MFLQFMMVYLLTVKSNLGKKTKLVPKGPMPAPGDNQVVGKYTINFGSEEALKNNYKKKTNRVRTTK